MFYGGRQCDLIGEMDKNEQFEMFLNMSCILLLLLLLLLLLILFYFYYFALGSKNPRAKNKI